jgi:uncharacterized protein YbjQ (UPF0145 family)
MKIKLHSKVTGFSGTEIFCLAKLGYKPGQLCLGNNVLALGLLGGIGSSLSNLAGGEIKEITKLVHEGRQNAFNRMMAEAKQYGGIGIAGVSFDLINHGGNLEFIAMGSTIHEPGASTHTEKMMFSTSASGQELYCQKDAGFQPHSFVFSNIAYSIGVGGSIKGVFRSLKRGEVPQYTEIFNRTRHLALARIKEEAKAVKANAVIDIETSIMPLLGAQEMIMTGTASSHPALNDYFNDPVTCDMTNEELWNIVNLGYLPIRLVIGVSVYSLGLASGISASLKSLMGGQVQGLTEILYEAREKALERIQDDAQSCNADEVVGVKTRIYELGGGLIEVMVIGTAVKKIDGVATHHDSLLPQAIIQDRETLIESFGRKSTLDFGQPRDISTTALDRLMGALGIFVGIVSLIAMFGLIILYYFSK